MDFTKQNRTFLFLSGVRGDTRRYRSLHPYQQMGIAGLKRQLSHLTDPALASRFQEAGLAILHRVPMNSQVEKLLSSYQARGGLAVYDADDLIFDLDAFKWIDSPDFRDPVRARLYQEDMRRYHDTLEACDAVTLSTSYLTDHVKKLNKPVWVHRNAFSLEMSYYAGEAQSLKQKTPGKVLIGYASGTPTHQKDFKLVQPALEALFGKYPQVELCLLGDRVVDSGWQGFLDQYQPRIHFQKRVSWRELPFEMARWDINLAPLVMDNPFTQSKSEIKFMEAGLVRVPTIASPTEAFQFAIRPGENGFLAANDGEWLQSLEALMDAELRRQIGERAHENIMANYCPQVRGSQLVEVLGEIIRTCNRSSLGEHVLKPVEVSDDSGNRSPDLKSLWIDPVIEQHPTLVELGMYNLRHRSAWTLIQQAWIYFRRMLVPIFPY